MINIEKLEDYIEKYKNHLKFLQVIKESNINNETITLWENKIEYTFKTLIKSSL